MGKSLKIRISSPLINFVILATGLCLPLLLSVLIRVTGYSEIVEELAKGAVVLFLILKLSERREQVIWVLIFGLAFGLSEALLYLNNLLQYGNLVPLYWRLALTVPMHIVSVWLIWSLSQYKKILLPLGLILAILWHYGFNAMLAF